MNGKLPLFLLVFISTNRSNTAAEISENTTVIKALLYTQPITYFEADSSLISHQDLVFPAAATCEPGQFTFNYTDPSCYTCPAGKFRSVPQAWAPMQVKWDSRVCKYGNRMYQQQPVYYCSDNTFLWWWVFKWIYYWGAPCIDGCSCPCGNGGWGWISAIQGGYHTNGQYPPVEALVKATTDTRYCIECPTDLVCVAGTYISYKCDDGRAAECTYCPSGTYTSIANRTLCTPCEPGTYSQDFGATSCKQCASGTYSNITGGLSVMSCVPCEAGTYANTTGQSMCNTCPAGMYANDTTSCRQCTNT